MSSAKQTSETFFTGHKECHAGGFNICCTRKDLTKHPYYQNSCGICMDEITSENNVQVTCGHNICSTCAFEMLRIDSGEHFVKCPYCRKDIDDFLFQNRKWYKPLKQTCTTYWEELQHEEYLNREYYKEYKAYVCNEDYMGSFEENYRYTMHYKKLYTKKGKKPSVHHENIYKYHSKRFDFLQKMCFA
tara:strand:- start:6 stop:569 length:564 start_codon:yes stop_codon:yes gene_type:complete